MRCTRCDQPVFIQALGRNPNDELVFGSCMSCLVETQCLDIEAAVRVKRPKTRLVLTERPGPPDPNRKLLRGIASGVATWGLILFVAGLSRVYQAPDSLGPNPLGNDSAGLFLFGGVSLSLFSLSLHATTWSKETRMQVRKLGVTVTSAGVAISLYILSLGGFHANPWPTKLLFILLATIFAVISMWSAIGHRRRIPKLSARTRVRQQPQSPTL